jgi:hypothetical protein
LEGELTSALGKTRKLSRQPLVHTDAVQTMLKRRLKQAGCRPTIHLTHSGPPASRIFWKMTVLLKPLSESLAMPIAALQNFTTAAAKRCFSKIWSGLGTELEFKSPEKILHGLY